MKLWILFKPSWLPLTPLQQKEEGCPVSLQMKVDVHVSTQTLWKPWGQRILNPSASSLMDSVHWASSDIASSMLGREEVQSSHVASTGTAEPSRAPGHHPSTGTELLTAAWRGLESRLPFHPVLAGVAGGEGNSFFLWCLAAVEQLLSKSLLSYEAAPFLSFDQTQQTSVGLLLFVPVGFPGCQFFQLQVWNIWGKRKTQGTHHHLPD